MKTLLSISCGLLLAAANLHATILFSDNFDSYSGTLAGQGPWLQNGTSAATPIQVSGGKATLGTSGQDINAAVSSYTIGTDPSIYLGATINVTSAQTAGDYFLHWAPATGSTIFISRTEIRKDVGGLGFNVGLLQTASATISWGTGVYSFGQDYRLVVGYNSVSGTQNDTGDVWVNGTQEVTGATWSPATSAEQTVLGSINLRQGSASAAPALFVDDLVVTTTFAEANVVPEPSTAALCGLGLLALNMIRRRS